MPKLNQQPLHVHTALTTLPSSRSSASRLNGRDPPTAATSGPPSRPAPSGAKPAAAARQAPDYDVEQGEDTIHDDKDDSSYGVDYSHDDATDRSENALNLKVG
jgi:hypothetical protein